MMRTSQAIFLLTCGLALPLTNFGCSSSSLSGGNGLTGGKDKDKDKDKSKDEEPTEDPAGDEGNGEGTDPPVWVNASYLTCVPEKEKSDDINVAVLCGLDDEGGNPVKPDGTKVDWSSQNSAGDVTEDSREIADTDARIQGRFFFPGKFLAKRAVSCQFNGGDAAHGKKIKMTDAIKGLEEDGELMTCLEAEGAVAKDCVKGAEDPGGVPKPLTSVRAFVLGTVNTGLLDGIAGADTKCQDAAAAASLTGKYRAVLSSSAQDAIDLVPPGLPIVEAVSGNQLAANRNALFLSLATPFVKDETGANVPPSAAWTGTDASGHKTGNDCNDWTSNSTDVDGSVGRVGQVGHDWLFLEAGAPPCITPGHLYCVEVQ